MRNDDIYIDCPRKGNGYNGSSVGFSDETYLYYFGKSSSLFRSFLRKLVHHTYFIGLRFACSYCRQSILADYRISPFHFRIIISRVADLDFDKDASSSYAGFGDDIDDTMLLSGMIFPIESMPSILQWISHIIPAKWYIMTVKKLMIEGVNVSLAWQEISILMFMSIILITISLKKFKNRLE